ncbi:MAG: hypothetical protein JO323_02835 [Acidobacteriia bacterium]|nr:hypothetical protein [Terriglobia bacterium]
MFDSAIAFNRYRLEVAKSWPDGEMKDALIAAIQSSLRNSQPRKPAASTIDHPRPPQLAEARLGE